MTSKIIIELDEHGRQKLTDVTPSVSTVGYATWSRLAKLLAKEDEVVTHLVVDENGVTFHVKWD